MADFNKTLMSAIVFLFVVSNTAAQSPDSYFGLDNPLEPTAIALPILLGGYMGVGPLFQTGAYRSEVCDCPDFLDGSGTLFSIGTVFDYYLSRKTVVGLQAGYASRSFSASYVEAVTLPLENPTTGEQLNGNVRIRQNMDAAISSISAFPYLKYYPIKWLFVRAGVTMDVVVASNYKQELELLDRRKTLPDGSEVEYRFSRNDPRVKSSTLAQIADRDFPSLAQPLFAANLGFGMDLRLGRTSYFSPFFTYNFPLNGLSNTSPDFKLHSWMAGVELRIKLRGFTSDDLKPASVKPNK